MLIRIFGITTPTGNYLFKKVLSNNYKNIYCYSRYNKNYDYIDLSAFKYPTLIKECTLDEIWIFLCPIWEIGKFLDNLIISNNFKKYKLKGIICCSSTSLITKKYSWHKYDKNLISLISSSEEKIINICNLQKICLSIIRPTLIYGDSGVFKDKNINRILEICKKMPFIIIPSNTGERQPIHISQLAKIIELELKKIATAKNKNLRTILNIGGDEILNYEMLLKTLLINRNIKKIILKINSDLFFLILSPLLILNSRLYSEILRIMSDLSGFQKSNIYLKVPARKFDDFI